MSALSRKTKPEVPNLILFLSQKCGNINSLGFLEYSSSLKDAQADLAKAQGIILLDGKLTLD